MWVDTHSHLNDEAFAQDVGDVVARASQAGVHAVLVVGTDGPSSQAAVDLATQYHSLFAVVGIQPNSLTTELEPDWKLVQELAALPKVVAIGETGLDRYWKVADFDRQIRYFDLHLEFAHARNLPVVIHCRESEQDILDCLRRFQATTAAPIAGVMHSFTGDESTARSCLELGLHISFAGMVTFKKSEALRQAAKSVPIDRILVETDSPYLSPEPRRGKRNEPAHVIHTGACLAQVFGMPVEQFAEHTTQNARRLFRLPG